MATPQNLTLAEGIIGYAFNNRNLLRQAFIAPGSHTTPADGNRRLAQLGDAVMKTALLKRWYLTPGATRTNSEHMLQRVASNRNLYNLGRNTALAGFIVRNPSQAMGLIRPRTMADTMEAILGAVYHDSDFNLMSVIGGMQRLGLGPV